jgi:integrase
MMGQVFQRTYRAPDGTVRTCARWTIRYFRNGRAHQEPTKFTRKTQAENLLKQREGDIAKGVPIAAAAMRTTFDEAAADVVNDYKANGKRSLSVLERRLKLHLTPFFGGRKLADISTTDVRTYITERQAARTVTRSAYVVKRKDGTEITISASTREIAGISNAEINRELQILKRCYSLAIKAHKAYTRPDIPMLREAAPRAGFFDRRQVDTLCSHLAPALADVVRFAFITGWRLHSEVLPLEWRNVDLKAGTVRLEAGTTKTGEARTFPITVDLRDVLERRQRAHDEAKQAGHVAPWVFFRLVAKGRRGKKFPKPITSFTKAWTVACTAACCPGRIPHDLRRSAVRTFVRAGLSEHVAMKLAGHRTPSVFRRYDIVSDDDLREAARTLDRDSFGTVARQTGTGDTARS